jgi:hypothetical protein
MQQDIQRHFIELALGAGKKYCHPDTKFITLQEPGQEGFIPLYENFLYALALLRSKTQENILEARAHLLRLFYFQHPEASGNFPLFVHEFPYARDHFQAVRILTVLAWIQKEFTAVLGAECSSKLKKTTELLVSFIELYSKEPREHALPIWASCKIACLLDACGVNVSCPDLTTYTELKSYGDPIALAEMISAYQLSPKKCDWSSFWRYLAHCWHEPSKSYVGPAYKVVYEGYEPQVTAFDYYMGYFSGALRPKADAVQLAALFAALVQPGHEMQKIDGSFSEKNDRFSWHLSQCPDWAISQIAGVIQPEQAYGFFPLHLVTVKHTLAMQLHQGTLEKVTQQGDTLSFEIAVSEDAFNDNKEKSKVLSFFFDDRPKTSIAIDGKKATCFEISSPVEICLGDVRSAINCKTEGEFVGHIARSNRHGQKRSHVRTEAFDVQFFIRALRSNAFRAKMASRLTIDIKISK